MRTEDTLYLVSDADRIEAAREAAQALYERIEELNTSGRFRAFVRRGEQLWEHSWDSAGGVISELDTIR